MENEGLEIALQQLRDSGLLPYLTLHVIAAEDTRQILVAGDTQQGKKKFVKKV